jgi:hypothetical protein
MEKGSPSLFNLRGGIALSNERIVKFMVTEWSETKFAMKLDLYSKQEDCELIGTGIDIDPFNGRTKYIAIFRKKVKA